VKVYLMHRDRDFELKARPLPHGVALVQDLELDTLFAAMAAGDEFLLNVVQAALLTSLSDPQEIRYRQDALADCLEESTIVREIYAIAVEAIERERKVWGFTRNRDPEGLLYRSVEVLKMFVGLLTRLRDIANAGRGTFRSDAFTRLFAMLVRELDNKYFNVVKEHLRKLTFPDGVLISAELGQGNRGIHYELRKSPSRKQVWKARLRSWREQLSHKQPSSYVYEIADRDEGGFRALAELRSRGISRIAGALAQSTDHILAFFNMLRLESGFYVGCLNLRDRLDEKGEPMCVPEPIFAGNAALFCRRLYDVSLSLTVKERVVGNDVDADDKWLVMITGANRGGKSTFLRSVGQAQLMMQCGLFVSAESFRANVCSGLFTHFKRGEDASMKSGKLDEELGRMSMIVDHITPNSIVLFNESFASTNTREGSEIASGIVRALLESGIKVFYVTHLFDLARRFYLAELDTALFLRAERLGDARRTFRLSEGEPLPTSYGEDLYRQIFAASSGDTVRDVCT
jgi:hypothetical protein